MSKYMTFTDAAFKDRESLLQALAECGYQVVEEGESLSLYGYQGDRRPETAQIVIRRDYIGAASNDLGFQKTDAGFVLKSTEKLTRNLRGTLHQERIGSTIKIRIKY